MNKNEIKALQKKVGTHPDGVWGSDSIKKTQKYLKSLMPYPNPWPDPRQTALRAFYGNPGDESQHIRILVPEGVTVRYFDKELGKPGPMDDYITVHKKCAESLKRILIGLSKIAQGVAVLRQYAGVYNNRSVRNGSTPSLHAYAAAIDLDPSNNGNNTHWPMGASMPIEVMEVFAKEGWLPAGAFWHRDAMHFQATRDSNTLQK